MDWYIAKNNELINISDIPCLDIETLRQEIIKLNKRVVAFFGKIERNGVKLYLAMPDASKGQ